jgi:hypothetical protein
LDASGGNFPTRNNASLADSLHKKNTGRRWTISLIQKALDVVAWDM